MTAANVKLADRAVQDEGPIFRLGTTVNSCILTALFWVGHYWVAFKSAILTRRMKCPVVKYPWWDVSAD